jgi:hypothetical protein
MAGDVSKETIRKRAARSEVGGSRRGLAIKQDREHE